MEDMEYFEVDTIIVTEEDGTTTEYAVLDKFNFEGKDYTVLAEVDGEDIADDEYLYTYVMENDEMVISSVEDDAEFERVSAYYDSLGCEE